MKDDKIRLLKKKDEFEILIGCYSKLTGYLYNNSGLHHWRREHFPKAQRMHVFVKSTQRPIMQFSSITARKMQKKKLPVDSSFRIHRSEEGIDEVVKYLKIKHRTQSVKIIVTYRAKRRIR